jgi:hypothetical protein
MMFLSGATPIVAKKLRRVAVPREIAKQIVSDSENAAELRAQAVDLNNDGKPELIVRGSCSVVGNCSTWIFRKTKSGYQELLINDAQIIRFGRVGTHGYRDIIFKVHGSAYESNFFTYKFDGTRYHLMGCLYRNYAYIDKEGDFHIRKRPQISKCCAEGIPC